MTQSPIFVYGALRSGTTLLHLMLGGHRGIHSASEADYLFDHITPDASGPGGWRYDRAAVADDWIFRDIAKLELPDGQGTDLTAAIVDQLMARVPDQRLSVNLHRNAPLAHKIFPDAKFIHLLRDPRDVARSSVGMGWTGNSFYGVDHWIATEQAWAEANIPDDQVFEIRFEDLMQDLETGLSRMCDFLGLPFDPAMLDYHENSTYGPPDPSIAQKWKTKASVREIALIEGRVGELLTACGYEPNGGTATPGMLEALSLTVGHRANRWKYNINRYGPGLFFTHHIARVLRLRQMAETLAARKAAIDLKHLK